MQKFSIPWSKKRFSKKGFSHGKILKYFFLDHFSSSFLGRKYYTPILFKRDNRFQYFSLMKSSDDIFHFRTCILPDHVAHESLKEFWTNIYRISANSFRGNYSFLNLALCTVTFVHSIYRCRNYSREEIIQGQKLFAEIRYFENMRAGFHMRWQKSLWFVTPKTMHEENILTNIMS